MIASSVSHRLLDQVDRNLLQRAYSAQLPSLNAEQFNAQREFNRDTLTTTYRDEIIGHGKHGNLIQHYGNFAHNGLHQRPPIKNTYLTDYTRTSSSVKPFLTPSYQNLTQNQYMFEKNWKSYSNNYRTSEDNVSFKRLDATYLPHQTKLPQYYKVNVKPIALVDNAAVFEQEIINGHVNDYFTSKKFVKSEMMNVRDTLASAMQLADFLRNKRFDSFTRKLFKEHLNGLNELDIYGDYMTQLIGEMKNLMRFMDLVNNRGIDLRKMVNSLAITEKVVDSNLVDRNAKPLEDRKIHIKTEVSIHEDKNIINDAKDFANKILSETQLLLNAMKAIAFDFVNNVLEEAKIIYLEKIDNKAYQREYVRDSNGYIKSNAKKAKTFEEWTKLADNFLEQTKNANKNAERLITALVDANNQVSSDVSKQILSTHEVVKDQIETDLNRQGILITQQKDLKRELRELNQAIADCQRKLGTVQIVNEVNLTKLTSVMPKVDMITDDARKRKIESTNRIWECATDLRQNLTDMLKHKQLLEEDIIRLDRAIQSSHAGVTYEWKTIANPRRHATTEQPAVSLVRDTYSTFF